MPTPTCANSNTYWIPIVKTYTGTKSQPDNVSLFIKNGNQIKIKDEAFVNSMGHSPWKTITAVPRIQKAAKRFIAELRLVVSRENTELGNAFKNLVRGAIQLCPLLGNVVLIGCDYLKTHLYFHPKLKAALASENGPIMGIAFDGKVVATFTPEELTSCLWNADPHRQRKTRSNDNLLEILKCMWTTQLLDTQKTHSMSTRLQLAQRLQQIITIAARA